jgi:hypothetical protein
MRVDRLCHARRTFQFTTIPAHNRNGFAIQKKRVPHTTEIALAVIIIIQVNLKQHPILQRSIIKVIGQIGAA